MKIFGLAIKFPVFALAFTLGCVNIQAVEKEITLTEPGTISSLISDSEKWDITELTVAGPINGTDILFIREMLGRNKYNSETKGKVTILDLNEANIVEGGGSYVYSDNYTQNNVIGINMFAECEKLKKIKIPQSTVVIDVCAFYRCYDLEEINIPDKVEEIYSNAFFMDSSLSNIYIPASVKFIDYAVFSGCTNMTTINVDEKNIYYESIDGVLYDESGEELLAFPSGLAGSFTTPSGVKTIAPGAFNQCSLSEIIISEGVEFIGDGAFSISPSLESVVFPNSLKIIDEGSFTWSSSFRHDYSDKIKIG